MGLAMAQGEFPVADHLVHNSVLDGFLSAHKIVPLRVGFNPFERLTRMFDENLVEFFLHAQHFPRVDLDIGGLALKPSHGLVDEDSRVGKGVTFALGPRGQQERSHARRLPDAYRLNIGLDVLHDVVDG